MANKSFGGHLYGANAPAKLALLEERSQSLLEAFEAMEAEGPKEQWESELDWGALAEEVHLWGKENPMAAEKFAQTYLSECEEAGVGLAGFALLGALEGAKLPCDAMWKPGFKASSSARRLWDFVPIVGGGRPLTETELRAVGLATREMFWRHIERSEKAGAQYLERCIVASELMSPKLYGFEVYEDDFSSTDWPGARRALFSAYECSALDEVAFGDKAGPRRSPRI